MFVSFFYCSHNIHTIQIITTTFVGSSLCVAINLVIGAHGYCLTVVEVRVLVQGSASLSTTYKTEVTFSVGMTWTKASGSTKQPLRVSVLNVYHRRRNRGVDVNSIIQVGG